jgi:hypothetical protein
MIVADGYNPNVFLTLLFSAYHTWLLHKVMCMHETTDEHLQRILTRCAPRGEQLHHTSEEECSVDKSRSPTSETHRQSGNGAFNADDSNHCEGDGKPGKVDERSDAGGRRRSKRPKFPTRRHAWEEE